MMHIAAFADTQPAGRIGLNPVPSENPADDRRIIRIRQNIEISQYNLMVLVFM